MSDSTQSACVWAISSGPVDAGGGGGEFVAVDELHAGLHGVDAEAGPDEVEERQRREHVDVDPVVGEQEPTVRSSTSGEPGTAYSTSPCSTAAADEPRRSRA